MKKKLLIIIVPLLFLSCNMKPQEDKMEEEDYKKLEILHESNSFELEKIIDERMSIEYTIYDSISKYIIISAFDESQKEENREYKTLKLDLLGNLIDNNSAINRILNDGTDWHSKMYTNWVIDNNTLEYNYKDPLSPSEKNDFEKWFKKFKSLYEEASYVYLFSSDYFFKINNEWFIVADTLKESPMDFRKQYPAKEDQDVRMLELKDQFPNLFVKPAERDTSLIKQVKYTSTFFEKSDRGDAFNYSAGWWYFDIYMPGGDTLKIKRFASFRDPEMKLYRIPKELGGRDDVLFIIQEPNEIHPEQTGGMYVIRPKNYKETPQYKEQQEKELEKEKQRKQKESQEAVRKRRSFLPEG